MIGPALALLALAFAVPRWALFFSGGSLGWLLAIWLAGRGRERIDYQKAVRHLRRNEIAQAIAVMDALIQAEPEQGDHYRFRAQLCRLAGNLDGAERDYQQMVYLAPGRADGYLGLAEVAIQREEYERARKEALLAATCAPDDWQVSYTLALLADRQGDAHVAVEQAEAALRAGIADRKLALLIHLWRARGYARLGDLSAAHAAVQDLRREAESLREWQGVLGSPQGESLQAVLGEDVRQARALVSGEATSALLAQWRGEATPVAATATQEVARG